jgi:hypothetical protein
MNLTEDSLKEICNRMDVDSLYNFIQTSEHNYNLCARIYDLKYYEEVEYPELMFYYEAKQKILQHLNNISTRYEGREGLLLLSSRTDRKGDKFNLRFAKRIVDPVLFERRGMVNIPGYQLLLVDTTQTDDRYFYPNMYEVVQYIMSIEDPNIKLLELRRLV